MLNKISTFQQFKESTSALPNDNTQEIEDLCLYFGEKWGLSFETHSDHKGYISIQRFDNNIQFGIQLNETFDWEESGEEFENDLNKLIDRIEMFGYEVSRISWKSQFFPSVLDTVRYITFSFEISKDHKKF